MAGLGFGDSFAKSSGFVQEVRQLITSMTEIWPRIHHEKLLVLFYQLAPRLDDARTSAASQGTGYGSEFQSLLRDMISVVYGAAPRQCFPVLYALMKNDQTSHAAPGPSRCADLGKIQAVQEVIGRIIAESDDLRECWE